MISEAIKDFTPAPEKFSENPRLKCHVFQVSTDAKPEAVIDRADALLYVSRRLLVALTAASAPDETDLSFAAEFLADAAQAGYRSLVGEP